MNKILKIGLVALFSVVLMAYGATTATAADKYNDGVVKVTTAGLMPVTDSTPTIGADGSEFLEVHCDTLVVGGDSVTGASQISTPMEDQGTYVRIAGDDDIKLYDNGNVTITGDMDADMYVMENDGTLDNAANGTVTLLEGGDTLSIAFDGDDITLTSSDGSIELVSETDATEGTIEFSAGGDVDDFIEMSCATTDKPVLNWSGCDAIITASGGDISFGDENLLTTGTIGGGALTVTSITGVDTITGSTNSDVISLATDDVLNFTSNDETSVIEVMGFEAKDATIRLSADESDDAGDTYNLTADATSNNLTLYNESTALVVVSSAGNIDQQAGTIYTMANDETIKNATDDTVQVASNDTHTVFEVYSPYATDGTASIVLSTDASTDAGDRTRIQADGSENLIFSNDSAVADTFVTTMTLAGATGNLDITGDLDITGGDVTCPVDLTITPTGAEVIVMGGVSIGDATQAGDNNLTVAGTATIDGTSTLVGDVTLTADIDIDGGDITCPADLLITPTGTEVHIDGGLAVGDTTAVGDNNLKVAGTSLLVGAVTTTADIDIDGGDITCPADLTITPTGLEVIVMGGVSIGDATQAGDNNLTVAGTATIDGTSALVGDVTCTGDVIVNGADVTVAAAGVKLTGSDGDLTILGLGDGNDESLNINFDDGTANYVDITSASGVTVVDFNTIDLATDAMDLSDGNIANVGDIALDSLTADGTIVIVTAGDHLQMGTATGSAGNFTMIEGATGSDPTFSIDQTTNDVIVSQTVGKMTIVAATDIYLDPDGLDIVIGDNGDEDYVITIDADTADWTATWDEDNSDMEISGNLHMGATVADNVVPDFWILADADSDGAAATTSETLTIKLTANATPTSAVWAFTNTQCAGYTFDDNITAVGSFIIGSADMNEVDLEKLDGITNGTVAANKALVADASLDVDMGTGDLDCTVLVVDSTANIIGALTTGTLTSVAGDITMADAGTLTLNDDGGGNSVTVACNSAEDVATVTGGLDITGAVALNGDTVTCDADLTITAAGADVLVDSGLTVGSTTQAGDDNLRVEGQSTLVEMGTVTDTTNARTVAAGDYGKTIFFSYAGAVAVTLPAAGEPIGSWFECVNATSDTVAPTYSTPVADNLVTFNNATADSVTFGSGHRIGSCVRFISNGSFWCAFNQSANNTMTVTDV